MGFRGKGTLMGTPNTEPQEYSRSRMECRDPGRYIPSRFPLYSWGSLFGVSIEVPLLRVAITSSSAARDHIFVFISAKRV